jgi:hypothetical protein
MYIRERVDVTPPGHPAWGETSEAPAYRKVGEDNAKERRSQRPFTWVIFAVFPSLRYSPLSDIRAIVLVLGISALS